MQLQTVLDKSITQTAGVLRGVKPDQLSAATPCADWDVRTLTNHLLQVVCALELAGRTRQVPGELWGRDLIADGWADGFHDQGRAAAAAWAADTAWDGAVSMGESELPAPLIATMLAADLAIHGWDLARATGQDYRCDDDVAEVTCGFVTDMGDQGRQLGIFAESRPVAQSAPALQRALALSGRDPGWTRPAA
ncbi:MAG TPA: TIGR03086 family metal-binding protein [Catenuloplanes sp.]|jgi:uncharacterized protein (TIGR03086 family)